MLLRGTRHSYPKSLVCCHPSSPASNNRLLTNIQAAPFLIETCSKKLHCNGAAPQKHSSSIVLEIDDDIQMNSYPGPLSQVIINFINNAILHAFEASDAGMMRLSAHKHGEQRVMIRFKDNGLGISASVLRRIFGTLLYHQVGQRWRHGLGMHLAYNVITQAFGGKIDIQSEPQRGTTIILDLPLIAPNAEGIHAKLGVLKDVLDDYHAFLNGRAIAEISYFGGPHSRRDGRARTIHACHAGRSAQYRYLSYFRSITWSGICQTTRRFIDRASHHGVENDLHDYLGEILISDAFIRETGKPWSVFTHDRPTHSP